MSPLGAATPPPVLARRCNAPVLPSAETPPSPGATTRPQLLLSMFALTLSLGHIPSMEEDEVLARASRNELQQLSCSGLYWRWYVSSRVGQRSIIA